MATDTASMDVAAPKAEARTEMRYYWIDLTRGLAALAVVLWHYQHFYYNGLERLIPYTNVEPLVKNDFQPFYWLFGFFYEWGAGAVGLFWCISGFVFTRVYLQNRGTVRAFVVNRFARLYPLHFLTLMVMVVLQSVSWQMTGTFQMNPENNWYHFVLHLFMASAWGLEDGHAFNGVIWSVSLELLMYAIFFVTLPLLQRLKIWGALGACILFIGLGAIPNAPFLFCLCGLCFYMGVLVYLVHERTSPIFGVVGGSALIAASLPLFYSLQQLWLIIPIIVLFLGIMMAIASLDAFDQFDFAKRSAIVGDLTYSIYLWHFPIQVAMVLVMVWLGIDYVALANGYTIFFVYIGLTLVIAYFSYNWFEKPARDYFRQFAAPRRAVA